MADKNHPFQLGGSFTDGDLSKVMAEAKLARNKPEEKTVVASKPQNAQEKLGLGKPKSGIEITMNLGNLINSSPKGESFKGGALAEAWKSLKNYLMDKTRQTAKPSDDQIQRLLQGFEDIDATNLSLQDLRRFLQDERS